MNTLKGIEQEYRVLSELKKLDPELAGEFVLFNQRVLTAAGKVHVLCLDHWDTGGEEEYEKFKQTFPGMYYENWRKNCAVSVAHCLSMYMFLNVKFSVYDIRGETFYAGVPLITKKEVEAVPFEKYNSTVTGATKEKIGIDGCMHPTDSQGEFLELVDADDIYGDGTGVTLQDLQEAQSESSSH